MIQSNAEARYVPQKRLEKLCEFSIVVTTGGPNGVHVVCAVVAVNRELKRISLN